MSGSSNSERAVETLAKVTDRNQCIMYQGSEIKGGNAISSVVSCWLGTVFSFSFLFGGTLIFLSLLFHAIVGKLLPDMYTFVLEAESHIFRSIFSTLNGLSETWLTALSEDLIKVLDMLLNFLKDFLDKHLVNILIFLAVREYLRSGRNADR